MNEAPLKVNLLIVQSEPLKYIQNAFRLFYRLESLRNNPDQYVYDYFEELKRQVDLRRETLKQEIDVCSDQIIRELENKKSELMKLNRTIKLITNDIEALFIELKQLEDDFESRFRELDYIKSCCSVETTLEQMLEKCQDSVLQNKKYSFEFDKEMKSENFFGSVVLNWNAFVDGNFFAKRYVFGICRGVYQTLW